MLGQPDFLEEYAITFPRGATTLKGTLEGVPPALRYSRHLLTLVVRGRGRRWLRPRALVRRVSDGRAGTAWSDALAIDSCRRSTKAGTRRSSQSAYGTSFPTLLQLDGIGGTVILDAYATCVADNSAIEWTEATWNPVTGCSRTSPGCDNCYALALARRLKAMGNPRYQLDGDPLRSGPGFGLQLHEDLLGLPRAWRRPRYIFVNSMSDLFHAEVPLSYIKQVFATMNDLPHHRFQVLTKRSKRLSEIAPALTWTDNIWMGVSVENEDYQFRIDHLRGVPARIRFLSLEPLLGPLGTLDLRDIDWVIVGGESGVRARPVEAAWVRAIRDQCMDSGVPFFFKQWGGRTSKAGGRDLDDRTYSEMPV